MANENEEFDVDALNAGLNADPENTDPNESAEEEETPEVQEEHSEEAEEEEGQEEQHAAQEAKSRKEARLQKLANERAAEREQRLLAEQRAQLLERQLEEFRRMQQKPTQEEENLDPLEKWQRDANKTLMQVQFRQQDMDDKAAFLFAVSKNPAEAAYVERVEAELAKARQNGANPNRESILIYLMGRDARAKMAQAPAIKREAAARVKAAAGKPLGSKSNVAPSKTESTEYDRLKDIPL